ARPRLRTDQDGPGRRRRARQRRNHVPVRHTRGGRHRVPQLVRLPQAFTETFSQAVNSEVRSLAFASKAQNGYFFNLSGNRYQNFESTAKGDYVSILHIPSFEVGSVEKRIRRTPFVFSYGAAAEGVSRREPGFETDPVVGR